jgi:hypothetical protein
MEQKSRWQRFREARHRLEWKQWEAFAFLNEKLMCNSYKTYVSWESESARESKIVPSELVVRTLENAMKSDADGMVNVVSEERHKKNGDPKVKRPRFKHRKIVEKTQ